MRRWVAWEPKSLVGRQIRKRWNPFPRYPDGEVAFSTAVWSFGIPRTCLERLVSDGALRFARIETSGKRSPRRYLAVESTLRILDHFMPYFVATDEFHAEYGWFPDGERPKRAAEIRDLYKILVRDLCDPQTAAEGSYEAQDGREGA